MWRSSSPALAGGAGTGQTSAVTDGAGADEAIEAVARAFHGLINSAAVIIGGAETLQQSWGRMSDGQRDLVIGLVLDQSRSIQEILRELSQRPPAALHAAIERHTRADANLAVARDAAADL
jgi:hypothetical protein